MPTRCLLLLASGLLLLGCGSCSDPRARAERELRRVGAAQVRQEAALLYKDVFAGQGGEFQVVKPSAWPRSFAAFAPRRVGAYADGFSLALVTDADTEAGLYVIPKHMEHQPGRAPGAQFERLAEGIYWYTFDE